MTIKVMYSGGARGADTMFGEILQQLDPSVTQYHIRAEGNTKLSPSLRKLGLEPLVCPVDKLDIARSELKSLLGITYGDTLGARLQLRNYYQVVKADSVFAVAEIVDSNSVKGGTNTAVQVGIKLNKRVYVLNLLDLRVYEYLHKNSEFILVDDLLDVVLGSRFAGVGSRTVENYNIQDKSTRKWIPSPGYIGPEKEAKVRSIVTYILRANLI